MYLFFHRFQVVLGNKADMFLVILLCSRKRGNLYISYTFSESLFFKKKENSVAIKWLYSEYLLVTDTGGILIPFNYGLDFCFDSRPWVESP